MQHRLDRAVRSGADLTSRPAAPFLHSCEILLLLVPRQATFALPPGRTAGLPGRAPAAASWWPATVSWSVSAITSSPASRARRMTSAGGSVPSEAEDQCRGAARYVRVGRVI